MANPAIIVDFIANTDKLAAGFRQAGSQSESFGSKVKGLGKAAVVAGGAAGLAALTGTLKVGIDEMTEASKVSAQTAAAIKSTGGAAGVSAAGVAKLAGQLMRKSGVDDEAIQSGENLLLTFTNIRNEAGRGNDVFNQTTKAALDMSVALGTDMKSASLQLGKALNDPIKGVTKLTRSGVTFTDAQKKQIAALQESGKTMEAQKIILAEVNKEFGGSAEAAGKTLPGQINVLKESFSNLAGELVSTLVPALSAITSFFVKNPGLAKAMVIGILAISAAMIGLNVALALTTALATPWIAAALGIGLAVAAVAAGLIYAYKTSDTFRAIVDGAFAAVRTAAETLFGFFKATWPALQAILTNPVQVAVNIITAAWNALKSATSSAFSAIRSTASSVWNAIGSFISSAVSAIGAVVSSAWSAIRNATSSAWGGVRSVVSDVVGDVKSAISGLGTWISGWASGTFAAIMSRVGSFFDRIADGARDAVASVQRNMNAVVNAVESVVGRVANAAEGIASAIKRPINAVINAWNGISFSIPKISIPKVKIGKKTIGGGSFGGQSFGVGHISPLAAGGIVTSPTLALIGEAGPEAVVPLDKMPSPSVQVRVFIGEQELTSLVRTEIVQANTGLARALLAG